jgi:NADPH:quinone reductase-like Zn-dependent oxidoreductase
MEIVEFDRFGPPPDVLECKEREDPVAGPGYILIRMLRMPINPADLLLVEGRYGLKPPPLPCTPGAEGVGVVVGCGDSVVQFNRGDLVAPLAAGLWRSVVACRADQVIRIPPDVDLDQAAMLKANPATAAALVRETQAVAPGLGIIQNAANSAVGKSLAVLAQRAGIPIINVVRRDTAAHEVRATSRATYIVVHDGVDPMALRQAVQSVAPGISLGIGVDAVGGSATNALAACLAPGGTVLNYGLLSGASCQIDPSHLIFRGINLKGFWLPTWFRKAPQDGVAALYTELLDLVRDRTIHTSVEATYPLRSIKDAVRHAARGERGGKVLLSSE